jgi:DNA-binding response OmpR family regulator
MERTISAGSLSIDSLRHEVRLDGNPLNLTLAEFNLLKLLVSQVGRVFTRDQLLNAITNGETYIIDRNVDVHIRSIRKQIGPERSRVLTVRGIGYKFAESGSK